MTARTRRAVRAVPGATSDRRDCVRSKRAPISAVSTAHAAPATVPVGVLQVCAVRSSAKPIQPSLITEASTSSEVGYSPAVINGQGPSPEYGRVPRAVVRNPYALIYVLERHRGSFEIPLLLDRDGKASKYRMRQQLLPRQKALDQALRGLVKMGLVEFECSRAFPFEKRYTLTQRGKEFVATPLRAWPQALQE